MKTPSYSVYLHMIILIAHELHDQSDTQSVLYIHTRYETPSTPYIEVCTEYAQSTEYSVRSIDNR